MGTTGDSKDSLNHIGSYWVRLHHFVSFFKREYKFTESDSLKQSKINLNVLKETDKYITKLFPSNAKHAETVLSFFKELVNEYSQFLDSGDTKDKYVKILMTYYASANGLLDRSFPIGERRR